MSKKLSLPLSDEDVYSLKVGDSVLLSGVLVTGRDTAHKWLVDTFTKKTRPADEVDKEIYQKLVPILNHGAVYHCGPVVGGLETGQYRFIAAGPTTSIREEPYQADVMHHFRLRGVIGKGGMGSKTLQACQEAPGVYLHAIGGAASLIAGSVTAVLGVYKLDFGVPEAIWVINVEDFPAVVTMDSHGCSLHDDIRVKSRAVLEKLIS